MGLIGAVGNVVYTAITLACGYTLDRYEKIRLYTGFTVFGGIVMLLFSVAKTIPQIILVRGLLGAAAASFWVSASTLTAEISPRSELTRSLGRYNLAWILRIHRRTLRWRPHIQPVWLQCLLLCLSRSNRNQPRVNPSQDQRTNQAETNSKPREDTA